MKKVIIMFVNVISAFPILIYPVILITSPMIFDAPGSGESVSNWIGFFALMSYPLFIIVFILLSRKKNSLILALVALIPLLLLTFVFLFSGGLAQKDSYNTLSKDFICDSKSFISINGKGNQISSVNLLEKKNFLNYRYEAIATIDNNISINLMSENSQEAKNLLSNCKNEEGKSLLDIYNLNSESE